MNVLIGFSKSELKNSVVPSIKKERILTDMHNRFKLHGLCVTKLNNEDSTGEHLWVRDNFFVLKGICFICNMTNCDTLKHNRRLEQECIIKFLETKFERIIRIPFSIEGGDVIVAKNDVFVGIGKRTSIEAFNFLKSILSEYRFHKVQHEDLHLDCCFAVLDDTVFFNRTKISHDDITNINLGSCESYEFIDIDKIDNGKLNTNFIVHGNIIFHGAISNEMLSLLQSKGYEVEQITGVNEMYAEGGGIRCLTQFF